MRGIIIALTIVAVVAIVMYGIVQIKRGKVETPSQINVDGPYADNEKTEDFEVVNNEPGHEA